ncbi:MAG TPA: hypothetical protein P5228_09160 [Bacteroidales bacterium]|nr:hypothetical protein [Bacteroidales bacterium]HRZ50227.1 hypothetical protein [Bacteroidales bacterium]
MTFRWLRFGIPAVAEVPEATAAEIPEATVFETPVPTTPFLQMDYSVGTICPNVDYSFLMHINHYFYTLNRFSIYPKPKTRNYEDYSSRACPSDHFSL